MKYIIEESNVRYFLSQDMFDRIEEEAKRQAKNCAMLPGLVSPFCVMPDVHTGYGCPIGGVGAYDEETGIISPGMCGYDINCLDKTTKIIFRDGYYLEISKIRDLKEVLINNDFSVDSAQILFKLEKLHNKIVIIKTKWGRKLIGSLDHPILCVDGYKKLSEITKGDKIVVYPFSGVKYTKPKHKILVNEHNLKEYDKQVIKYLRDRRLVPLYLDSPYIGIIARILGYAFVDGYIDKNYRIRIYSKSFNDLLQIKNDLEKLKIGCSINKHRNTYVLSINSKSFGILMNILGLRKTKNKNMKVPKWIFDSPKWIIRNFLSALFGADGSIINIKRYNPININLTSKCLEFLRDVKILLRKFKIKSRIYKAENVYRLYISGEKNILRFLSMIGYEYNEHRRKLGNLVCEYLRRKRLIKRFKKSIFSKKICNNERCAFNIYINSKYLLRLKQNSRLIPRISYTFETFEEFVKKYSYGDFIIDEVIDVKIVNRKMKLYDLGIKHESHNFIANNIVVHNCGVRLLTTDLYFEDIKDKIEKLGKALKQEIPAGLGEDSYIKLTIEQLKEVCEFGAEWAVDKGYGYEEDLKHIEENGKLEDADPKYISQRAFARGRKQLGSIGAGNHFVEVLTVSKIFNESVAKKFGLDEDQVCVLIHTGSRGFGHQIATDFINLMETAYKKYNINLPDIQLACVPFYSEEGQQYWVSMKCAANYAFANRQVLTYLVRESFNKLFECEIKVLYDICHNIVKLERHKGKSVLVHRKGATRSFPEQPVLIPGSMGTSTYVLIGTEKAMSLSFGSSAHGSGRVMSRRAAIRQFDSSKIRKELKKKGIYVFSTTEKTISEESPYVYKNVDEVVKVVDSVGISKKVAKLEPKIVILP